jgi:hypothetical protein
MKRKTKKYILAEGFFDNSAEGYIVRLGERSGYHVIEIPKRLCVKENDNCQIVSPKYRLVLEEI